MLSIEEAWARLDKLPRYLTEQAYHSRQRDLALAVWEDCYAAHYPCTRDRLCGPHADRLARIEALGT